MLRRNSLLFFASITLLIFPVSAQPSTEYPMLDALRTVQVPPADTVDLARRLRGFDGTTSAAVTPPTFQHGDRDRFWVSNSAEQSTFEVEAVLRAIGDHVYLWVQSDATDMPQDELDSLVAAFDERIYEPVRALWGSEPLPGVDGDPRLHILMARGLAPFTAAYFARRHTFPEAVLPLSNEREMFVVNLDLVGTNVHTAGMEATLAHEFQHMIRTAIDYNEDTWLNEGFSTFTELYLGYDNGSGVLTRRFFGQPETQLTDFGEAGTNRAADYGAALAFVTYFYERFGLETLQALSDHPANGWYSVEAVLDPLGEDADVFFADWVMANMLDDAAVGDGRYAYELLQTDDVAFDALVGRYPAVLSGTLNQYGTAYYLLNNPPSGSLQITLEAPADASLIPTSAPQGDWMWYSHRGDVSNTRLYRAFDLTDLDSATLAYDLWYDLEAEWDYGYIMVSVDDGETFQPLATPHTTTRDPYGNAYGPGYTGSSGGWIRETVSLDSYAGQKIIVSFETITDDAINLPGMALDNITVAELDFADDVEGADEGWQTEGWIRTDNRLPQQFWVQAAIYATDDVQIQRWLSPDQFTLSLPDDVQQVVVALSPFAPVTTLAAPYTLVVSASE